MRQLSRGVSVPGVAGGLVLSALALTGCQETPSYAVRWRVVPPEGSVLPPTVDAQDDEMTSATVCSRVGVSKVEVWVFDDLGFLVDDFVRPCFPAAFKREGVAVNGTTLPAGDYTAVVFGTRATSIPWGTCPRDPDGEPNENCDGSSRGFFLAGRDLDLELCDDGTCGVGLDTCDCQEFTVVPEQRERLPDFALRAPPDCEDGIDGDNDGLVDQLDPGCQAGFDESTPVLVPEIALSISVLSGNPVADCDNIGVGALAISIDGRALDPLICSVGPLRFSVPLPPGPHELTITGIRAAAGALVPVTVEKTLSFTVEPSSVVTPSLLPVDFADVDLLEPLFSPARFTYALALPDEEVPDEEAPVFCVDPRIGATDYRLQLLDAGGRPVTPTPASTVVDVELDGSSGPCVVSTIGTLDLLQWGAYFLEAEAYTDAGDLCWSNADDPAPLKPFESTALVLELAENAPASCFEG